MSKDNYYWMPPNKQLKEREGVYLTHEPRSIRHFKRYDQNEHGWWSIDTMAISIESIRAKFWWRFAETLEATENLQIWINNLGPALYNPCHWYLSTARRKIDGTHRMKVLEAMNFDYAYIYLVTGRPNHPNDYWNEFRVNDRLPVKSASLKDTKCPVCGERVKWEDTEKERRGKCSSCVYEVYEDYVYPEPVSIQIPHVS